MKAVSFPKDKDKRKVLKEQYIEALGKVIDQNGESKLEYNQGKWEELRSNEPLLANFPADLKEILTAEYSELIRYYQEYVNASIPRQKKEELVSIFSYSDFYKAIAGFFMELNLSVCHYCGMAYINKYTVSSDQEGLYQLNVASSSELAKLLGIKETGSNQKKVLDNRPYTTVEEFNSIVKWRTKDKFHSVFPKKDKKHFDLDHVLPKAECPITSISLMNFVPSCGVCNGRLKKTKILGDRSGHPIEELSPTSDKFDFENQVEFTLIPTSDEIGNRPTECEDGYELEMNIKKPEYEWYIQLFHLKERYQFHKREALFWLELKRRYTDSRISMIAEGLQDSAYSVQRIKADIFQEFLDQRERCLEKLKKDILK